MADTKAGDTVPGHLMPDLAIGDRVRHYTGSIGTVTGFGPKGGTHITWLDGGWADNVAPDHFALAEVAHYAPPGVTMVAMTPERITALEVVDGLMSSSRSIDNDAAAPSAIRAMLAEARGQVSDVS